MWTSSGSSTVGALRPHAVLRAFVTSSLHALNWQRADAEDSQSWRQWSKSQNALGVGLFMDAIQAGQTALLQVQPRPIGAS